MKVLWVVNKAIGKLHEKMFGKKSTGGLWLEAMVDSAKQDHEIEVIVVNVNSCSKINCFKDGNITYYTIPGSPTQDYDYKSQKSSEYWKYIITTEKPELIELWGTEMPYGLSTLKVSEGIPHVVFVQGVLESIGRYYRAGMSTDEIRKAWSLRDFVLRETIDCEQKRYFKRSNYEKDIVSQCGNIIVENDWAKSYYLKVNPNIKAYWCPLSLAADFSLESWDLNKMQEYTIMCPAANYPIKGLHMLLKALYVVKDKYPNVQLLIPGTQLKANKSIKDRLKERGYDKYIKDLIKSLGLSSNVIYLGRLTAHDMAKAMSTSNCFVMSSAIENHSSTLKEAMTVGVPCVSSYVGGVPEYAINNYNCLLYRYEDYEMLAYNIIKLFESKELCKRLSVQSQKDMRKYLVENDIYAIHKDIYYSIIK